MMLTTLQRSKFALGAQGYRCGPEQAETVVLLHGVGLALEAWTPQIESLSTNYQVIALDLPGHGNSAAMASGAVLQDYVDWLAAVLAELSDGPVSLAGHSMGALIALGMAVEHPLFLKRVALLNGVYQRDAMASEAVLARAQQISTGDTDPTAPLSRWFDEGERQGFAYQLTSALLHDANAEGYAAAYHAFASGDRVYAHRLDEVICPLLALTGDGDSNSTPEMAQSIAAGVNRGRAVVIEGHRHMLNLTAPEQVNAALLHWLKEWK